MADDLFVSSAISFLPCLDSFAFGVIVLSAEGVFAWTHVFDHRLGKFVNEVRYRTYFES